MDIDITKETLITLAEAAARLPRRPSLCTMHRWGHRGVRGTMLSTVYLCGRRYTSIEALHRFLIAASQSRNGSASTPQTDTHRAFEADRLLSAKGV